MNPMRCPCGKAVHVRVIRIRAENEEGTSHWIEHRDGSPVCFGDYQSMEFMPYTIPRVFVEMVERWNKEQKLMKNELSRISG